MSQSAAPASHFSHYERFVNAMMSGSQRVRPDPFAQRCEPVEGKRQASMGSPSEPGQLVSWQPPAGVENHYPMRQVRSPVPEHQIAV